MKKLLLKIFIFFLPFLVFGTILETRLVKASNIYSLKKKYLEAQLTDIVVLVTGSSHSVAINPSFFSYPGYNLFYPGQDIYYDVEITEKYLDQMPNLKMLIIPVSYFSYEYLIGHENERLRPFYYFHYWGIPALDWTYFLDLRAYSYTALFNKNDIQEFVLAGFKSTTQKKILRNGWYKWIIDEVDEAEDNASKAKKRVSVFHKMMNPQDTPIILQELEGLIKQCNSRKIQVVLVTIPLHHSIVEKFDPQRYQRMQGFNQYLVSQYDVPYFNYQNDSRFVAADFTDIDHMSPSGAEKFTRVIDKEILKKYIK